MTNGTKKTPPPGKGETRATAANDAAKRAIAGEQDESVERIRDILFGTKARQYENQFKSLEEAIAREVGKLADRTSQRFESLERQTKKDLDSLASQLQAERTERSESVAELTGKLEKAHKDLEKKLAQLAEKSKERHDDLYARLMEQSRSLQADLKRRDEELTAALKDAAGKLQQQKTDRLLLATMFAELALRLKEGLEES
ncbi:MAG: hypothetical protein FIA95_16335 [Gemmatimonadetes bacterium]|nr:hypothetical protein [Gemmatimonadota bacterium]